MFCFDSNELLNENIGFFINQELFCKYLQGYNYKIFWTVLAEKRIISERYDSHENYRQPRISGIFTMYGNGDLIGTINQFKD